ncbi:DNA-protecting protein DprA [Flavobacterium sp. MAH-1]|uniref:DNA-protecting protein DprA n=1 Tax=Flavobacterium agri TaxID=2743471 RepID=A0A7Y8Y2U3_9FLAO|nr:DNA-processing protein DprA [Flavobacterium agri]NUY80180.1 DNA-protecting protein DprA [Flavobacterium agri]NYA70205.1 DNA-protecting protein DprA [Flavobacterium agri]
MRHEELVSVLALQKVEGVGDIIAKKLLSHFKSAREIFETGSRDLREAGIGTALIPKFKDKSVFAKAEAEARIILDSGIKVCCFLDEDYPERLKHCVDGPLLLFSTGNIDLTNRKIISIVGTRNATAYGNEFCRKLVSDLAPLNPIIVSGFALGIDIIAHQAALENDLQTIAVIGNGLKQVYPKAHKKYIGPINSNGGFFSEFWSNAYPAPENFVRRNRIVAGMSEATIIIESAEKGGSLITANLANDYNRDVFAVPGRVSDVYSQGCNKLIKTQRAHLLTGAADLIYMMNWDLKTDAKPIQKQLFVSLSDEEQIIYDFLVQNGKETLDVIATDCGISVYRLSSVLLTMELKSAIRPLPGKVFEAI